MERVAEAMSSIVAFMEPDADGGRPEYQGKFQADIIEQSYARLRDGMPRDLNYSSDGTDLNFSSYDIAPILESLKFSEV